MNNQHLAITELIKRVIETKNHINAQLRVIEDDLNEIKASLEFPIVFGISVEGDRTKIIKEITEAYEETATCCGSGGRSDSVITDLTFFSESDRQKFVNWLKLKYPTVHYEFNHYEEGMGS